MPITYDEELRCFALHGDNVSYVLAVDGEPGGAVGARVRHRYWGPRIADSDLASLLYDLPTPGWSGTWSRPRAHTEEYVVHGGLRYDECALKVDFPDGVRELELEVTGHEVAGEELSVSLVDRRYDFHVVLHYRVRPAQDAVDRWVELANEGAGSVVLQRIASATWPLPQRPGPHLTSLVGRYAVETQLTRQRVNPGVHVLESRRGIPGHAAHPVVAVDYAGERGGAAGTGASEEHGDVWSVALAWSGSWKISTQLAGDGALHVTAGVNDFDLRHELAPGDRLTLPVTTGIFSPAGFGGVTRRWHSYERSYVDPRPGVDRPVSYNSWEATFYDVECGQQIELARRAADLGVELFIIDDGWFRTGPGDESSLGDWRPAPHRFPNGLRALADEVHLLGMRFGVWVEPEMLNRDSDIFRAHPDWVYRMPGRTSHEVRHQLVLDLGRAEVQDAVLAALDDLVGSGDVDYLKWDMNRPLGTVGTPVAGAVWWNHVVGVHRVIDRLRARHPDLWIETCASGGGRADLAILSRTELAWPSDNTDAADRVAIQRGYSFVHPASSMLCWVTDVPAHLTKRTAPLSFRFHVAMSGVLGLGGNLLSWGEEENEQARRYVAQYKKIRSTVQHGQLHRLEPSHGRDSSGICHISADGSEVAVFVFARAVAATAFEQYVRLRGLDPKASYVDTRTGRVMSGALLHSRGLVVELKGDLASALLTLRRL